jgi:hypothetical protein
MTGERVRVSFKLCRFTASESFLDETAGPYIVRLPDPIYQCRVRRVTGMFKLWGEIYPVTIGRPRQPEWGGRRPSSES